MYCSYWSPSSLFPPLYSRQEPAVRQPTESEFRQPPGLCSQHHREGTVYERGGPQ